MTDAPQTTVARTANRLIDVMLAAQSRFAQAWRDNAPLTAQQERDEVIRDKARADLLQLLEAIEDVR